MTTKEAIAALDLFNEKVDRFLEVSASKVSREKLSATLSLQGQGKLVTSFVGPDGEPLQALALTLRFFIQNNEPTSLARMRGLYLELGINEAIRDRFLSDCQLLNEFLATKTKLRLRPGTALTYRDVLNIYVYGDLAHSSSKHRAIFLAIRPTPAFVFFQLFFGECLREFSFALESLRIANAQARAQLAAA